MRSGCEEPHCFRHLRLCVRIRGRFACSETVAMGRASPVLSSAPLRETKDGGGAPSRPHHVKRQECRFPECPAKNRVVTNADNAATSKPRITDCCPMTAIRFCTSAYGTGFVPAAGIVSSSPVFFISLPRNLFGIQTCLVTFFGCDSHDKNISRNYPQLRVDSFCKQQQNGEPATCTSDSIRARNGEWTLARS